MKKIINFLKKPMVVVYCLALMVACNGYMMLHPILLLILENAPKKIQNFNSWQDALNFLETFDITRFMMGLVLICMACTLLMRTRIAFLSSLLLLLCIALTNLIILKNHHAQVIYALMTIGGMLFYWRHFDKHSLSSTSIFSVVSILSLIVYGILGTLYLGNQFTPPVKDLPTAFYFVIVCMSTVGFGDIIPHTTAARIFTVTMIIFGITIFAASIASVAGSLIRRNVQRILKGRFSHVAHKNHYIIAGSSVLVQSVWQGLVNSGGNVTIICEPDNKDKFSEMADVIEGDPSSLLILEKAGASKAKYIVALMDNDADNAFMILAAKEAGGDDTKTIALVNESHNMTKMKQIRPDSILSLQQLGSEILVRTLNGEPGESTINIDTFFNHKREGF